MVGILLVVFLNNSQKKERNNQFYSYKIAFEYAGDGIKDMVFSMEEIFLAAQLYKDVLQQKKVQSTKRVTRTLNPIVNPEKEFIYKFNADDVNGDAIESDDEEEEDEMKQKLIRVKEGNCFFINNFKALVSKISSIQIFSWNIQQKRIPNIWKRAMVLPGIRM